MKHFTYCGMLLLLILQGCAKDNTTQENYKWRVTLDRTDKRPYGTYLAYESLKYYFEGVKTDALSHGFRYTNMKSRQTNNSLLILEGLGFWVSGKEWEDLKLYISNGNEVMVFCSWLDTKIEKDLNCYKLLSGEEDNKLYFDSSDFSNQNVLTLAEDSKKYGYVGRSLKGYFTFVADSDLVKNKTAMASSDNSTTEENATHDDRISAHPDILGYAEGHPDLVRYKIGDGHITIHGAPLVLSNYFLLQAGNENYLTSVWQTLPENINHIYWNDFYRRTTEASSTGILWQYPATRLALIIGISALLIYVLFEGKRKQRIIPIIPPIKNDSVSFVETVGRLYYNKGNHTNLADKMVQQFLEWVRTRYFLNTNLLNEAFIAQLTIKSGQSEPVVRWLVEKIHQVRLGDTNIDDAFLYKLYNVMQKFYKKEMTQLTTPKIQSFN